MRGLLLISLGTLAMLSLEPTGHGWIGSAREPGFRSPSPTPSSFPRAWPRENWTWCPQVGPDLGGLPGCVWPVCHAPMSPQHLNWAYLTSHHLLGDTGLPHSLSPVLSQSALKASSSEEASTGGGEGCLGPRGQGLPRVTG